MDDGLRAFLSRNNIIYVLHTHPAVFTVAQAEEHCGHIPGLACKNLFLKDSRGQFCLAILPANKRLDTKGFKDIIGAEKVRFGTDEELFSALKLTPGSVSPFGLINDEKHAVVVYVDRDVWHAPIVTFHPNINTATMELTQAAFRRLFAATGHTPHLI